MSNEFLLTLKKNVLLHHRSTTRGSGIKICSQVHVTALILFEKALRKQDIGLITNIFSENLFMFSNVLLIRKTKERRIFETRFFFELFTSLHRHNCILKASNPGQVLSPEWFLDFVIVCRLFGP